MPYKYRHTETYKGIRIDKRANTMKELMAKVEQKKKEIDGSRIDGSVLLSKYAEKWAETYKKPNVSPAWYADIERRLRKAVEAIGDKPIGKIKSIEVQAYLNTLRAYCPHRFRVSTGQKTSHRAKFNGAREKYTA